MLKKLKKILDMKLQKVLCLNKQTKGMSLLIVGEN